MIFKLFTRDFPVKKIIWKKFLKWFLLKIEAEGKFFKRFPCINPRASLARAAFNSDFLYNQKGRRSIAGTAQQLEPAPFPSHSVFFSPVTSKVTRDISNSKIVTGYFSFHGLLFRKLSRVSQNCHGLLFRKLSRVTKKMSRVTIAKFHLEKY